MSRIFKMLALGCAVTLPVFIGTTSFGSQSARNSLADVLRLFPGYRVLNLNDCDPDLRGYLRQKYPIVNLLARRSDWTQQNGEFGYSATSTSRPRPLLPICDPYPQAPK